MKSDTFQECCQQFKSIVGPDMGHYPDRNFWKSVGHGERDRQLTELADCLIRCTLRQKQFFRSAVHDHAIWNLIAYVRRVAVLLIREREPIWLRRGLEIAILESGRFDYRDSICSLVILRAAAESIGLDPIPDFDKAIRHCDSSMEHILQNARDHLPKDVRDILRMFGPDDLKTKRSRKSN
jgi:hypothetical protein